MPDTITCTACNDTGLIECNRCHGRDFSGEEFCRACAGNGSRECECQQFQNIKPKEIELCHPANI